MKRIPIIGITLGDPAGVGSEILAKMLTYEKVTDLCIPIVIGNAKVFQQGLDIINSDLKFKLIKEFNEDILPDYTYIYDLDNIMLSDYSFGEKIFCPNQLYYQKKFPRPREPHTF